MAAEDVRSVLSEILRLIGAADPNCHFCRKLSEKGFAKGLTRRYNVLIYVDAYIYSMSKLSRQAVIRGLINDQEVGSQDDLRRAVVPARTSGDAGDVVARRARAGVSQDG